jgi:xanthine dehydrogenase YagS FAD-binding subunit
MHTFEFVRAVNAGQAVDEATKATNGAAQKGYAASTDTTPPNVPAAVRYIAGGTTLLDLMKLDVETPSRVIDINQLPFNQVESLPDGGLKIGALVRNSDLANHPMVLRDYPVLSLALKSGASAQLRNMATTGGNLLQRTRCMYFRDTAMACNKRAPGSGCAAIGGTNRNLAILGTSEHCIATNPSDMNVALTALEATIVIRDSTDDRVSREVPIADFFLLPGTTPERETILKPGDLITHVILRKPQPSERATYLKLRDRASYEFALASAAVILTIQGGTIQRARVAMGGVGTRPWRAVEAEKILQGAPATNATFTAAADAALADARAQSQNGFKVVLAKRCLVHALTTVAA